MNKKIACFALASKCGGFADSKPRVGPASAAAAEEAKNPSRDSRSINASPAKPPPTCDKKSRRFPPPGVVSALKRSDRFDMACPHDLRVKIRPESFLVRIDKLVEIKNDSTHFFESLQAPVLRIRVVVRPALRLGRQKVEHRLQLAGIRWPDQRQLKCPIDLLSAIVADLVDQARGEGAGLPIHKFAVEKREGLGRHAGVNPSRGSPGCIAKVEHFQHRNDHGTLQECVNGPA